MWALRAILSIFSQKKKTKKFQKIKISAPLLRKKFDGFWSLVETCGILPDGNEFSGSPQKTIHGDWSNWFFHLFERGLVIPRLNVEDDVRFGDNFSFLVFFCGFSGVVCSDAFSLKSLKVSTDLKMWSKISKDQVELSAVLKNWFIPWFSRLLRRLLHRHFRRDRRHRLLRQQLQGRLQLEERRTQSCTS